MLRDGVAVVDGRSAAGLLRIRRQVGLQIEAVEGKVDVGVDPVGEDAAEGEALEVDEQDRRQPRDRKLLLRLAGDLAPRTVPATSDGIAVSADAPHVVLLQNLLLDEGLDAFVVIDGLPVVPEDSKSKLVKFVLRKLNSVGRVKDDGVHMPVGDSGKTEGYVGDTGSASMALAAGRATFY